MFASFLPYLRIITLILTLLILINYIFSYQKKTEVVRRPRILVDHSGSMELSERQKIIKEIEKKFPNLVIPFAEKVGEDITGNRTDIGSAIRFFEQNPIPLIIATDGNYNLGPDPLQIGKNYPCPIYPVKPGPETIKNLAILVVYGPHYSVPGDTVRFIAKIENTVGRARSYFKVQIDQETLLHKAIDLRGPGIREETLKVFIRDPGKKKLFFRLEPIPGEIDSGDNSETFELEVIKKKINLLFLGQLSPDVGIMRRVIGKIEGISPEFRVLVSKNETLKFGRIIGKPDIIVLDRVNLKEKVEVGLLIMADDETPLPHPLRKRRVLKGVSPRLEAVTGEPPPFENLIEVIAPEDYESIIESYDGHPILLTRNRMVILLGYPFWSFYRRLVGVDLKHLGEKIIEEMIALASPSATKRRIIVRVPGRKIRVGDETEIACNLYTAKLNPLSGGRVFFRITSDTVASQAIGFEKMPGHYVTTFRFERPGRYRTIAQYDGLADTAYLRVVGFDPETPYHPVNHIFLEKLARITGGKMIELSEIPGLLKVREETVKKTITFSFRNPIILVIIIGLLSLEWFWRKKEGMS